jgi:FlaA1/EpsC-like NDP-sugar epimerase
MLASRNESFKIQAFQLADAFLVWLAFWLGGHFSDPIRKIFGLGAIDASLASSMNWVLYIAVPFTPLVLEHFGFYNRLRQKTAATSANQLFRALLVISLILAMYALFAKQLDARRLVVGLGIPLIFFMVFCRDRVAVSFLRQQMFNDAYKERVIVAGTGNEMHQLYDELDPEITSAWKVIDHFDLKTRRVEELFESFLPQKIRSLKKSPKRWKLVNFRAWKHGSRLLLFAHKLLAQFSMRLVISRC